MKIQSTLGHPRFLTSLSGRGCSANRLLAHVIGCLIFLTSAVLASPGASLEWDANSEADVAGYKLYYGTASGSYSRSMDAGDATTATVPELISGFTYYFAVTAYNDAGLESPPSNEVTFTVPWPAALQLTYLPRPLVPIAPGTPIECTPVGGIVQGSFAFRVTAPEQSAVTIYASRDLNTWEIQGTVTNPTGQLVIRDLGIAGYSRRFYRLSPAVIDPIVD